MSWASLSLVTDAEIGALEPEATNTADPWGTTEWANARAEAKRDLGIWISGAYPQVPGVLDRVLDTWAPDYVFGYTGGTYTDYTSLASNDTAADVPLKTIFATYGTDRLYLGCLWAPDALAFRLSSLSATSSVMTAKYWGATGWKTLGATDGTAVSGKTLAQDGRLTWTMPTDWQRSSVNGTANEFYWIELSVSAALTAGTAATQILLVRPQDSLKRTAAYLALYHIYNGLAAQAAVPDVWRAQAEKYWGRATELFTSLREHEGIALDLVGPDGVVTPAEQDTAREYGRLNLGRG